MHIILDGEVEVWGRDSDAAVINVCRFGYGDTIGELEFLNAHSCVADVVALTPVKTLRLKRNHFESCLGPVVEVLKSQTETETYAYYSGFNWSDSGEMASFISDITQLESKNSDGQLQRVPSAQMQRNASFSKAPASTTGATPPAVRPPGRHRSAGAFRGRHVRDRKVAVSSTFIWGVPSVADDFQPVKYPKDADSHSTLRTLLSTKALFMHLEDTDMDMVVDSMEMRTHQPGDVIIRAQETGDRLIVIMSGKCVKKSHGKADEFLGRGACFGEEQLMYSSPHTFQVEVIDTLVCFELHCSQYQMIVTHVSTARRALYEELLSNVNFLQSMSGEEMLVLADCLQPARFTGGEYIIKFGSEGEWMHIIVEGTVEVWGRDANGATINVCEFGYGDCIGELEFINNHKCVADVVAQTDVKTVKLNRNHFELCMGSVVDVLKRHTETETYQYYSGFDWTRNNFTQRLLAEGDATPTSSDDQSSDSGASSAYNALRIEAYRRRDGVSSRRVEAVAAENFSPTVVPKSDEDKATITSAMQSRPLFEHLDRADVDVLADVMTKKTYQKGECLVRQGDEDEHFYVIIDGACERLERDKGVQHLVSGSCFGELELMYRSACLATVTVSSDTLGVKPVPILLHRGSLYPGVLLACCLPRLWVL